MATRCNIIVNGPNGAKLYIYRHWDGYPAETGADIARRLSAAFVADKYDPYSHFLTDLLAAKRGGGSFDNDHAQYTITSEIHGDIEHLYEVTFRDRSAGLRVRHSARDTVDEDSWDSDPESTLGTVYTLREFADLVNGDIDAVNERIRRRNQEPGQLKFKKFPRISL